MAAAKGWTGGADRRDVRRSVGLGCASFEDTTLNQMTRVESVPTRALVCTCPLLPLCCRRVADPARFEQARSRAAQTRGRSRKEAGSCTRCMVADRVRAVATRAACDAWTSGVGLAHHRSTLRCSLGAAGGPAVAVVAALDGVFPLSSPRCHGPLLPNSRVDSISSSRLAAAA